MCRRTPPSVKVCPIVDCRRLEYERKVHDVVMLVSELTFVYYQLDAFFQAMRRFALAPLDPIETSRPSQ